MIDFASVTGIQLPEGSANALAIGGAEVWSAEKWDAEWEYNGSLPPSSKWYYTSGINVDTDMGAIYCSAPSVDDMVQFWLQDGMFIKSNRCTFEIETNIKYVVEGGFIHFSLAGRDDSETEKAVRLMSWLSNGLIFEGHGHSEPASTEKWYKIRILLDKVNNSSKIFIDNQLFTEIVNSNLDYVGPDGPAFWLYGAGCYVRAIRYKATI